MPKEMDELFAPTIGRVRICNHNPFDLTDRCDNIPYTFATDMDVDIPLDAAAHLFGFHMNATEEEMFKHCSKRFGWNTPMHAAKKLDWEFFDNLEIRPVHYKLVEVTVDEDGVVKRGRGRPKKKVETTAPDVMVEPRE